MKIIYYSTSTPSVTAVLLEERQFCNINTRSLRFAACTSILRSSKLSRMFTSQCSGSDFLADRCVANNIEESFSLLVVRVDSSSISWFLVADTTTSLSQHTRPKATFRGDSRPRAAVQDISLPSLMSQASKYPIALNI